MGAWDRSKALAAFEAFALTGPNAALAVYWLSLWRDNEPPRRADFNPARVRDLLPAIALVEMRSGGAAVCRLSGGIIDAAFGKPLCGVDLIALVSGDERRMRAERLAAVIAGGVGLSRTQYRSVATLESEIAETIQLPFFGTQEDGARQYLTHTNWRPHPAEIGAPGQSRYLGKPDEYCAAALV
jgi:hypothetical protein